MMYHYTESGLSNIRLQNGYEVHETPYGEAVSIHDMDGLHRAIGLQLVDNKPHLTGEEVRFLRIELDLPQAQLGAALGVSESTIRNWENGRADIPGPADRVLRLMYREYATGDTAIRELIDRISQLNQDIHRENLSFEETASGWRAAA